MELKIVFEDDYLLGVDKPSGLVVHSDGRTEEESLVDFLKKHFSDKEQDKNVAQENIGNPHTLDSGRYESRWGIINRLDRDTSGLVIVAKDNKTFDNLQKQFQDRTVVKEYLAVVWGSVRQQAGPTGDMQCTPITQPISRHKKDPRIWTCGFTSEEGGRQSKEAERDAETFIEVQSSFTPCAAGGRKIVLKMYPKTGRTHQLRLHARFIGHPIIGDKKYGINGIINEHSTRQIDTLLREYDSSSKLSKILEEDKKSRLMLHAKSLDFLHPITNLKIKIESDIPKDFEI